MCSFLQGFAVTSYIINLHWKDDAEDSERDRSLMAAAPRLWKCTVPWHWKSPNLYRLSKSLIIKSFLFEDNLLCNTVFVLPWVSWFDRNSARKKCWIIIHYYYILSCESVGGPQKNPLMLVTCDTHMYTLYTPACMYITPTRTFDLVQLNTFTNVMYFRHWYWYYIIVYPLHFYEFMSYPCLVRMYSMYACKFPEMDNKIELNWIEW